jgi:hypothetical protein
MEQPGSGRRFKSKQPGLPKDWYLGLFLFVRLFFEIFPLFLTSLFAPQMCYMRAPKFSIKPSFIRGRLASFAAQDLRSSKNQCQGWGEQKSTN